MESQFLSDYFKESECDSNLVYELARIWKCLLCLNSEKMETNFQFTFELNYILKVEANHK